MTTKVGNKWKEDTLLVVDMQFVEDDVDKEEPYRT